MDDENPAIIYHNPSYTSIIFDIPTSIAIAQELVNPEPTTTSTKHIQAHSQVDKQNQTLRQRRGQRQWQRPKQIISIAPISAPYPSPPEPKSEAARRRVLDRGFDAENLYHQGVVRLLRAELVKIKNEFGSRDHDRHHSESWWYQSRVIDEDHSHVHRDHDMLWESGSKSSRRNAYGLEDEDGGYDVMENGEGGRLGRRRKRSMVFSQRSGFVTRDDEQVDRLRTEEVDDEMIQWAGGREHPPPPVILSQGTNEFESLANIRCSEVRNPSNSTVLLQVPILPPAYHKRARKADTLQAFFIPPQSSFVLGSIEERKYQNTAPQSPGFPILSPIQGLPTNRKFDVVLFDPPWPNRSVRRSGQYHTHRASDMDTLRESIKDIIKLHLKQTDRMTIAASPIAAIWVTNKEKSRKVAYDAFKDADLTVIEEWIWLKVTTQGEPVTPLGGLWRKPYEILVVGSTRNGRQHCRDNNGEVEEERELAIDRTDETDGITRRIIAAVPDIHSRKPNLRDLFGRIFFSDEHNFLQSGDSIQASIDTGQITGLEVFARNLSAGWCSCGDEVLKFNQSSWWLNKEENAES